MIRVVPTGDLGLDVLVGGGWRLVKRFEDRESATVVVRGGSGAGKTLLALQVALELARALDGDVAVGCVEILPTEYVAQVRSARPALLDQVAMLPAPVVGAAGPRIYVGLLPGLDGDRPDLVTGLQQIEQVVVAAGGRPAVLIVDSLIEGYGIGSSAQRIDVDEVMKFAARYGRGLVLCEEVGADGVSPWVFAADTVLQLGVEAVDRGRWIEVRKHRFGPSATGRHELELATTRHPEVLPAPAAWTAPWISSVVEQHGWCISAQRMTPPLLRWSEGPELQGALFIVTGKRADLTPMFAESLRPVHHGGTADAVLMLRFDSLGNSIDVWHRDRQHGAYIPVSYGPARALRWMIERFAATFADGQPGIERIIIGAISQVHSTESWAAWNEAMRVFVSLVNMSRWGIPVVLYDTDSDPGVVAGEQLAAHADVLVSVDEPDVKPAPGYVQVHIQARWTRMSATKKFPIPSGPVDMTPRPAGRE